MRNTFFKGMALVLSLAMLACVAVPACTVAAADPVDLMLEWPAAWDAGTPPTWAIGASTEVQQATLAAINEEYNRQLNSGYNLGTEGKSFTAYGNVVGVQLQGANSNNVGNPWGQSNRLWAMIIAPYPGTAFSIKSYLSANWFPSSGNAPLGNQLEWTDPATGTTKIYQMIQGGVLQVNTNGTGFSASNASAIGLGQSAATVEKMEKAYAYSAWMNDSFGAPYHLGHCVGNNVLSESGIQYQEFFGKDSVGASDEANRGLDKKYGISYIVTTNDADAAYIITGEMFNAWREHFWVKQTSGSYKKFSLTGAPIGNQFTEDGVIYQPFEKGTICLNTETGEVSELVNNDVSIQSDGIDALEKVVDGNNLYYLMEDGTDLTAIAPMFKIARPSKITPAANTKQNFTRPVTYTVTAESGRTAVYTVTVFTKGSAPAADKAAVQSYQDALAALPTTIYRNNMADAQAVMAMYDAMSPVQKLLVGDTDALDKLAARMDEILASPIRVTCVGDSITDGIGASGKAMSYPSQMGRMLGDAYSVFNAGVSGTNAMKGRGFDYRTVGQYPDGKAHNPDIVIFALGTNDAGNGLWYTENGVTAEEKFYTDYKALVQEYIDLPSRPTVLLSLPMACWDTSGGDPFTWQHNGRHNLNLTGTIPLIRQVADELDLQIIDMQSFTLNHPDWFPDGLHPGDAGYTLIAEEYGKHVTAAAASLLDHSVEHITLDGEGLDGFDPATYNYTVQVADLSDLPEVAVSLPNGALQTATVTQGTKDHPVATVTIESAAGAYGAVYTIAFTNRIPGDVDMTGTVDVADIMKLKALIMADKWSEEELAIGDMDGSKQLDVGDIMAVKNIIMNT